MLTRSEIPEIIFRGHKTPQSSSELAGFRYRQALSLSVAFRENERFFRKFEKEELQATSMKVNTHCY